ncbi:MULTISPECIES: LysR family transcriptional regulator [unclassified Paraburkholderia]|uniref:LysR family transcriptional regulator n=1 Tax=unclassified Paraburkholderia TaxID=2615204 RepID=UPI002AB29C10|nr:MULTISPECIES: LysR family transcriptional regulator [unclassified Paraburkholderia]
MDRLTGLAVFVKAVDLGSFTAAGEAMRMSSQLVGRHVQAIERRLGVRLLTRTTRTQSLTEFGQEFYERAKLILAEVASAEDMAAVTRSVPSGLLRINAPVSFGTHSLAPRLSDYLRRYPDVRVELSLNNRTIDLVEEGYDVVFRVGEIAENRLVARRLRPYRFLLCAAPKYLGSTAPIRSPQDIREHDCLIYSRVDTSDHWTFETPDGPLQVPVRSRLSVDHGEPLLRAAIDGMGLLLQPEELVREALNVGKLVEVLPDFPVRSRPLHLLYAPDRRVTPKLRSFVEFAIEHFGSELPIRSST